MIGAASKALDTSIGYILETADQFSDELKKTAVQAGGTLNASDKSHQAAYGIFIKMIYATLATLRPHKD